MKMTKMTLSPTSMPEHLRDARRVVIKLGSSLIQRNGALAHDWLASVARDIRSLKDAGKEVLVVSPVRWRLAARYSNSAPACWSFPKNMRHAAAGQPLPDAGMANRAARRAA